MNNTLITRKLYIHVYILKLSLDPRPDHRPRLNSSSAFRTSRQIFFEIDDIIVAIF